MCIILDQVKFRNEFAESHLSRTSLYYYYSVLWAGGQSVTKSRPFPPCVGTHIIKYFYNKYRRIRCIFSQKQTDIQWRKADKKKIVIVPHKNTLYCFFHTFYCIIIKLYTYYTFFLVVYYNFFLVRVYIIILRKVTEIMPPERWYFGKHFVLRNYIFDKLTPSI